MTPALMVSTPPCMTGQVYTTAMVPAGSPAGTTPTMWIYIVFNGISYNVTNDPPIHFSDTSVGYVLPNTTTAATATTAAMGPMVAIIPAGITPNMLTSTPMMINVCPANAAIQTALMTAPVVGSAPTGTPPYVTVTGATTTVPLVPVTPVVPPPVVPVAPGTTLTPNPIVTLPTPVTVAPKTGFSSYSTPVKILIIAGSIIGGLIIIGLILKAFMGPKKPPTVPVATSPLITTGVPLVSYGAQPNPTPYSPPIVQVNPSAGTEPILLEQTPSGVRIGTRRRYF